MGTALEKFQRRYPDRKVELILPQALIIVSGDPILLEQVLVNLLENAVQHAEGMKHLRVMVSLEENTVTFQVADDGAPIPKDRMDDLFSGRTFPENRSPDQQKHNMGIGLSVCSTMVRAHGGRIWCENTGSFGKNTGKQFCFTLEAEEVIYES